MNLWINNNFQHYDVRNTSYNRSVCMDRTNIEKMLAGFDGIFNSINNFTSEIASLQLYPFKIKHDVNRYNWLRTTRGLSGVTVYNINHYANYVNLGQYEVKNHFNNFADYKGYTYVKVFLPIVGYVDVDVNECMGKWLQFRLAIDFYSGKGIFIIGVSENQMSFNDNPYPQFGEEEGLRILSTFESDIGIDIPLGQSNIGDIRRNILLGTVKAFASVGAAVYTNTLPPATTNTSSIKTYNISGRRKAKGARLKTIKTGEVTYTKTTVHNRPVDKSKPISEAVDSSIDVLNRLNVSGNTDRVDDSGLMWNISGQVKVVIYRPKIIPISDNYGSLYGYPLGDVRALNELSGYTEVNSIHFEGEGFETITKKEIALLEEIFSNGIFI